MSAVRPAPDTGRNASVPADEKDSGPLKQRLVEAALDGLRELDPEALLHAIGAREIARRAGGSPASIYGQTGVGVVAVAVHAQQHEVDRDVEPLELSETLVLLTTRRALTHRAEAADQTARHVLALLGL